MQNTKETFLWCLVLIILLLYDRGTNAVSIGGPIALFNSSGAEQSYMSTHNIDEYHYHLSCNYSLDAGESVTEILWILDSFRTGSRSEFLWRKDGTSTAEGSLLDNVNLNSKNGDMEIKQLLFDLWGNYTCNVRTDSNSEIINGPKEFLVTDTAAWTHSASGIPDHVCEIKESYNMGPRYPRPTVVGGIYSVGKNGFFHLIPKDVYQWRTYPNGSSAASFSNYTYKVTEDTPYDFEFRMDISVTQRDGTSFPFHSTRSSKSSLQERGCTEMKLMANYRVINSNRIKLCRNQLRVDSKVKVVCNNGFTSSGNISEVILICTADDYDWTSRTNDSIEDLQCDKILKAGIMDDENSASAFENSQLMIFFVASALLLHFRKDF